MVMHGRVSYLEFIVSHRVLDEDLNVMLWYI